MLLGDNIFNSETKIGQTSYKTKRKKERVSRGSSFHLYEEYEGSLTLGSILKTNIEHGIVKGPAHEKFQTKIVNTF